MQSSTDLAHLEVLEKFDTALANLEDGYSIVLTRHGDQIRFTLGRNNVHYVPHSFFTSLSVWPSSSPTSTPPSTSTTESP